MKYFNLIIALGLMIGLASCDNDDDDEEDMVTPPASFTCDSGTYCFVRNGENTVSFGGQTTRLNQLGELTTYMKTANNGASVSAAQMKEMFSNADGTGSSFFSDDANDPSKQLKSKCFIGVVDQYEDWMDDFEAASANNGTGSNGTAGVVVSTTNPSKQYFFNANGFEHIQLIEKGLMGDVFYFQAMETYIQMTLDGQYSDQIVDGKPYTEAEHKFDEAFGYMGIPVDFATNTDDVRFHGNYCNRRDAVLGTNSIFDDFLNARTKITAGDDPATDLDEIKIKWHKVCAGTAIHYLNSAKTNIADDALRNHVLSEAYAFIGNLLHNTGYQMTPAQVDEARAFLGTNFYETTEAQIDDCIEFLVNNTLIELTDVPNL
ncbi:MAG: DUF4856 domain-containing protein [Bacteroidota bacterium]